MTSQDKKCFIGAMFTILILAAILTIRQSRMLEVITVPDEPISYSAAVPALKETTTFAPFPVPLDVNIQWYINAQCEVKQIPTTLVLALIWQETRYINDVVGSQGELGLMQVHPVNAAEVAKVLNVTNLLDPYQNCKAGLYILDRCMEQTDTLDKALMIYNLGYTGAKAQWQTGVCSTEFSRSVLAKMAELENVR